MEPLTWQDRALCRGLPTEWWYPDKGNFTADNHEAIRICQRCPVKGECLAYANERQEEHGIWGGTTATKRGFRQYKPKPYGKARTTTNGG